MGIFTKRHSRLTAENIHSLVRWEVVDTAARLALTPSSSDDGKVAKQLDNSSYWILVDYSGPTWSELTSVGVAAVTSVAGEVGDVTVADMALVLSDITDIDLTGLADNYILKYDLGTATWLVEEDTAAGTGTWGFITGTIGNQADLQAELDAKTDTGHAHAASDITSGTLADAQVASSNVTQHEGDITHDSLGGVAASEHIDWSVTGVEQVHADRYATGTGGATNTVAGGTGITNTGDNVNAVLEPTYGATANTIAEGDDTRIVNSAGHATGDGSDHADVATNTLKVTNANHSGEVTGDTALTITANAVTLAKMAPGTPGGIIAYDTTTGDAVDIGVGTQDQVVTSNVSGVPTWEDQTGGGGSAITVQDDGTPLTTDVTLLNFAGAVVVSEPVADEITITVTPGSAPVASVFGRLDAVAAAASDYDASQVDNDASDINGNVTGAYVSNALDTADVAIEAAQGDATTAIADAAAAQSDATAAKAKTDFLSPLTGTIDMDQMDIDVGANNAKVTYDGAGTVASHDTKLANVTTITTTGAALLDDANTTEQRATLGLGSAAVEDVGVTIDDIVQLVNVGGNPGFPTLAGDNLTGIPTGAEVFVDLTDVDEADYVGHAGEFVKVNVGEDGLDFGAVPGGGDMLSTNNLSDVTNAITATQNLSVEVGVDVAAFGHTHDVLSNIDNTAGNGVILGRDTAGEGDSEELTPVEAAALLDHADLGAGIGTNSHTDIDDHIADVTTNPHAVNLGNLVAGTQTQLTDAVGDVEQFITDNANEINTLTPDASPTSGYTFIAETDTGDKVSIDYDDMPGVGGEVNDLATDGINGIADDQIVIGSGANTAAYHALPNGAVTYATATNTVSQAGLADLSDGATASVTSEGAGAPSSTPASEGDIYTDTTADVSYIAAGTASSADWKQATGTAGADLGGLSDVTLTSPATDAILIKTAGDWVDGTINTDSITDSAVTNAKLDDAPEFSLKGNTTTGAGAPTDLSVGTNVVVGRLAGNIVAAQVATAQIADDAVTLAKVDAHTGAVAGVLGYGASGAPSEISAGASGTVLTSTGTTTAPTFQAASTAPTLTKSITVEDPVTDETISMFYTNVAITVTQITAVIVGSTSVTFNISHGTSRAAVTNDVMAADDVADSTTTGNITTTGWSDEDIPADSFVCLTTSAASGTPDELHVTVEYTED